MVDVFDKKVRPFRETIEPYNKKYNGNHYYTCYKSKALRCKALDLAKLTTSFLLGLDQKYKKPPYSGSTNKHRKVCVFAKDYNFFSPHNTQPCSVAVFN